ncbi:MAG TPA: hypothetical protein VFI02_19105 [Armatimonadota bacterium]|nr:hypothetical protein [Armatimonadota bacterium]
MTVQRPQVFEHTLSFPEHIWLGFYQEFFQQRALFVTEQGQPVPNRFFYDPTLPRENRKFDISLAHDFSGSRQNQLPQLVLEETGLAQVGVAVDQLRDWGVSPRTEKERADLIRGTYIFHCTSKDRGESRIMASVILDSIVVFKNQFYENGINKIEPLSVGATQAMRSDSDQDFFDTPVQVTFEYLQVWRTIEVGPADAARFCFLVSPGVIQGAIRVSVDIADPVATSTIRVSVNMEDANAESAIRASADLQDPISLGSAIRVDADLEDPIIETSTIRVSVRIA